MSTENNNTSLKILKECITSNPDCSFNSHLFPNFINSIAIIHSIHQNSPILYDIMPHLKKFSEMGVQIDPIPVEITNPAKVANAIEKVVEGKYNILFLARGGQGLETFSDKKVITALLKTPKTLYRVMGLGHSTEVPLAYFFADCQAATHAEAAALLEEIFNRKLELINKIKNKENNDEKQQAIVQSTSSNNLNYKPKSKNYFLRNIFLGLIIGICIGILAMSKTEIFMQISPYINKIMGWGMYSY